MTEPIGHEEWIAELQRLQEASEGGEGWTTRELAEHWKCGNKTVLSRLHQMAAAGRLVACTKRVMSISGKLTPVSSYKLKPAAVSPPVAAKASSGRSKGGSR